MKVLENSVTTIRVAQGLEENNAASSPNFFTIKLTQCLDGVAVNLEGWMGTPNGGIVTFAPNSGPTRRKGWLLIRNLTQKLQAMSTKP